MIYLILKTSKAAYVLNILLLAVKQIKCQRLCIVNNLVGNGPWTMDHGPWTVQSRRLTIHYSLLTIHYQLSIIHYQLSIIHYQLNKTLPLPKK